MIHPLGIMLSKLCKRSGKHKKENSLSILALESTVILFVGLFIAYSVFQFRQIWFYPIMLMIIGGRYFIFSSIYGSRIFWLLGFLLSITGVVFILSAYPFYYGALVGGIIETIFAIVITRKELNS